MRYYTIHCTHRCVLRERRKRGDSWFCFRQIFASSTSLRSLSLFANDFHNKVPQLIALSSVCFDFTKFLLLPPSQVTSKVNSQHFHSCWCYTATVSSIWLDVVSYLHIDLVLRWFHHRQLRVRVLLWSTRCCCCCEALLRHSSQHAVPHLLLQRWLGQR